MRRIHSVAALTAIATAGALENGVGDLPEMGFNTWYMFHSHLQNYQWVGNYSVSEDALALAAWMKDKGFMELGYKYSNFDDCIVVGKGRFMT